MIKKVTLLVLLVFIIGCKPIEKIWMYKDTDLVDRPISTTVDNFVWDDNILGERDSIQIINKEEFIDLIEAIDKNKEENIDRIMNFEPQYAFVMKYDNLKDTLYFDYTFTYGYLVKNNLLLKDTTKRLKHFLMTKKEYKRFLEKDYYYYEQKFSPAP